MKATRLLTLVLLLLAAACTPQTTPPVPIDAGPPGQAAEDSTPISLPPTWTPTATWTPAPTATSTATATPLPPVSPVPTVDLTAIGQIFPNLDLSNARLFLSDLPPGFTELPLGDLMVESLMQEELDYSLLAFNAFMHEADESMVMSMTFAFPSESEIVSFDQSMLELPAEFDELQDLEEFEEYSGNPLFPTDFDFDFSVQELPGFPQVGEISSAMRMSMGMAGEMLYYDFVVFRREVVGAILFVIDSSTSSAQLDLASLALLLDGRLQSALEGSPQ
jgi:hypothetical protein